VRSWDPLRLCVPVLDNVCDCDDVRTLLAVVLPLGDTLREGDAVDVGASVTDAVVVELDVGAPDALGVELLVGVGIEL